MFRGSFGSTAARIDLPIARTAPPWRPFTTLRPRWRCAGLPRAHGFENLRREPAKHCRLRARDAQHVFFGARLPARDFGEEKIGEDLERRTAQLARSAIAQQVHLAQHSAAGSVQRARRFHLLPAFRVELTRA